MIIVGVDYHLSVQQVAFLDTETGETGERRLLELVDRLNANSRGTAADDASRRGAHHSTGLCVGAWISGSLRLRPLDR
jgi:hypothetical protein